MSVFLCSIKLLIPPIFCIGTCPLNNCLASIPCENTLNGMNKKQFTDVITFDFFVAAQGSDRVFVTRGLTSDAGNFLTHLYGLTTVLKWSAKDSNSGK